MNAAEISQYITTTFAGVDVVVIPEGDSFFFYNPDPTVPPDHMFPIITLVHSDSDGVPSILGRPGVFRLNIGLSKTTFRARFPEPNAADDAEPAGHYDYTALDQLMPHPHYGRMYWVSVLNPSAATFETQVQPLLAEAYALAVSKHPRTAGHGQP